MIYLKYNNTPKFFFLDDPAFENNIHFQGKSNRTKFLKEIEEWQKGGSYRKTHPIVTTKLEDLKLQRQNLEDELRKIEKEIEEQKLFEINEKIRDYQDDKDIKSINKFKNEFNKLLKGRYCIKMLWIDDKYIPILFDNKVNKYRGKIKFFDDEIEIEELTNNILKYLL